GRRIRPRDSRNVPRAGRAGSACAARNLLRATSQRRHLPQSGKAPTVGPPDDCRSGSLPTPSTCGVNWTGSPPQHTAWPRSNGVNIPWRLAGQCVLSLTLLGWMQQPARAGRATQTATAPSATLEYFERRIGPLDLNGQSFTIILHGK